MGGPRATRRERRAWLVVAALALALAACGADPSDGPTAAGVTTPAREGAPTTVWSPTTTLVASPEGLAATAEQYREDQVTGTMQIQVTNLGTTTVRLDGVALRWAGLTATPASTTAALLAPGQVLDFPIALGEAVCTDPPRADSPAPASPAAAAARAAVDGGGARDVAIPVSDTRGVLARIHHHGCQRQSVEWASSVAFDAVWTEGTTPDGRPAAFGRLVLRRAHGTDLVAVTQVNGSVLLSIAPAAVPAAGAPLVRLGPADAEASLPVVVTQSGRCEAHALAESKHTFFLPVALAVGDAPVVIIDVIPDDAAKLRLAALINRSCGLG